MKVNYYNIPADQAIAQKKKPKGTGEVVHYGQIVRAGTAHTSALIKTPEGLLVEVFASQVCAFKSFKKAL